MDYAAKFNLSERRRYAMTNGGGKTHVKGIKGQEQRKQAPKSDVKK